MNERTKSGLQDALEQELVLSSLESGQLAEAKKQHFPRRALEGPQIFVLWALRIYVLFMMGVVIYQIWSGGN